MLLLMLARRAWYRGGQDRYGCIGWLITLEILQSYRDMILFDVDVNAVVDFDVDDVKTRCRHDCIRPRAFP
jgi:hypothetical protein